MDENLKSVLKGIFGDVSGVEIKAFADKMKSPQICPFCKKTYADYKKTLKFGCSECYTTFRTLVANDLTKIHSTSFHKGKIPSNFSGKYTKVLMRKELSDNRKKLEIAKNEEDYLEAARLRDEIIDLENKLKEGF